MFKIVFKPEAIRRLKKMKRYYAVAILETIERHLREEPEKASRTSIKRLRGNQETTFRLRAGDYRVRGMHLSPVPAIRCGLNG